MGRRRGSTAITLAALAIVCVPGAAHADDVAGAFAAENALHLAAALRNVQTALDSDEGHFFYRRRLREILGDVTAACQSTRSRSSADQPKPRAPSPRPVSGS